MKILRISTESEFRNRFEEIASNPPNVAVLDVMLRWSDLGPSVQERPDDVREEGHFRAGLRCQRMITSDPRTTGTRVVIIRFFRRATSAKNWKALASASLP